MYKSLLRIFFKENFGLKKFLGTDKKKSVGKIILIGLLMLYALGSFLFAFGSMFFYLGDMLNQLGLIEILLVYGFIYSTSLAMMFVLFRANGYLFNYKDYEILGPLPIKTRTVILAKVTVMLTFIYLSIIMFLGPIAFSYFYHSGFDTLSLILFIVASFTVPLIPTIIFSFISLLIARVTSKFRKSNLVNIILLFGVFIGIMYLSFSLNSVGGTNPLLNQRAFMESLSKYYPPIKWFIEAVNDHNFVSLLLLLGTNAILFTGFILGIQKLVISTNQRGLSKVTRKNNKAVVSKSRSMIASIAMKESRTFFSIPIYALNVGFGVVLMFVLGIASLFFTDEIQSYLSQFIGTGLDFELVILILIGFCLTTVCSTAMSLSLEGKHFSTLKSLPIKPQTVMYGKMLFNVLLGLPVALITIFLLSYSAQIELIRLFLMMIFTISLSLVITVYGSVVNLFFPKFDFRNPAVVVKQSAAAIIGIFGGFSILVINGLLYYLITKSMSFEIGLLLVSSFNFLIFSGFLYFVNKKAESLFIKFEV